MDEITLRINQHEIVFSKSTRLAGVRPAPSLEKFGLAPVPDPNGPEWFSGFRLINLDSEEGILSSLTAARNEEKRPAVEAFIDGARENGAVATHVYHTSDDGVPFVPTGRLFVRFRADTSEPERSRILDERRLKADGARHGFTIVSVTAASPNPMKVASELQRDPRVESAEPDLSTPFRKLSFDLENDALLEDAWHLENRGVHGPIRTWYRKGADVRVRGAWERLGHRGVDTVRVAVIDDGFLTTHPALSAERRWAAPRNFGGGPSLIPGVAPDEDPSPRTRDDQHGTECAGLIGATGSDGHVVGVAPQCTLIPIRWNNNPDGMSLDAWFDHARQHEASVVSCSWGPSARTFELLSFQIAAIQKCALQSRKGRGALIVFAAGNQGIDISLVNAGWLNGLVTIEEVVIVAGIDSRGERWDGSNFGSSVTLCAPAGGGGDGGTIATCSVELLGNQMSPSINQNFGGTSAACALVAGVAALTLSGNPTLSAREVHSILARTAWSPSPTVGGAGDRSSYFGHGCVDASAAVAAALP